MGLKEIRELKAAAGQPKEKKIYRIPKQSAKKKLQVMAQKQIIEGSELERWFEKIAKEISKKPYCQNCGAYISLQHYRHATAHLLPKKSFPSVATHPANYLILGAACGCHSQTHRWDRMQKMDCFPVILQRLLVVEPDVAKPERKNLPKFLLDRIGKPGPDDIPW